MKVASNGFSLFKQTPQEVAGAAGTGKTETATKKPETTAPTDQETADEDADEAKPKSSTEHRVGSARRQHANGQRDQGCAGTVRRDRGNLPRPRQDLRVYHSDAEVCGLGSAENPNQPIPLGATRGEPTASQTKVRPVIPGRTGTAGPIWESIRKNPESYNPQNLDHNMAVAIAHLETLKKKYGEDRFRAYNGGTKVKNGLPR